jgi:ketosteroid isomerase-like protein
MKKLIATAALAFATATLGTTLSSTAKGLGRTRSRNRSRTAQRLRRLQAWADGTGSPYDLLASNVRWTIAGNSMGSKTYPSKEAFISEVIRPFNARMRDRLIPSVHRIYADSDTVVAHFDARGVALDGKPYFNSYAWILRMEAGQIIEAHAFFDAIAFDDLWTRSLRPQYLGPHQGR